MFHGDHKDLEGGASFGMIVCQCLNALFSLIWPTSVPHTAQTHTSNGEFTDASGPLFSMYSKAAEKEDNKTATYLQDGADRILVFVGPFVPIYLRTSIKRIYSVDYSLPLYRYFSQCRSKILNPGPKTYPRSTSGKFISVSLTPI